MSADPRTLAVYATAATRYAEGVARKKDIDQQADLDRFAAALPPGGRVLDLGCGPGQHAAALRARGLTVEASDASPEMAALALRDHGIAVRVEPFEALDANARYHGIWASFSLLHAPRAALPALLSRIHRALVPGGTFTLGMKLGRGEGRDDLDRFFAYYTEAELRSLLGAAGFTVSHARQGVGSGLSDQPASYVILTAHA
ncbi:MAG: class I SAM-dependent methyltransferase [Proteobacteria bacterium]|nr:class I SAM-dependent methyltransferase [Pseudomonadota bacterium]